MSDRSPDKTHRHPADEDEHHQADEHDHRAGQRLQHQPGDRGQENRRDAPVGGRHRIGPRQQVRDGDVEDDQREQPQQAALPSGWR